MATLPRIHVIISDGKVVLETGNHDEAVAMLKAEAMAGRKAKMTSSGNLTGVKVNYNHTMEFINSDPEAYRVYRDAYEKTLDALDHGGRPTNLTVVAQEILLHMGEKSFVPTALYALEQGRNLDRTQIAELAALKAALPFLKIKVEFQTPEPFEFEL